MTGAPSTATAAPRTPGTPDRQRGHARRRGARQEVPGAALRQRHDNARGGLSEQRPGQRDSRRPVERLRRQRHVHPAAAVEAALGQRDRDAALRAVVRRLEQPVGGRIHEQPLQRALEVRVQRRRPAPHQPVHDLQILAAAELGAGRAQQHDHGPGLAEHPPERASRVLDHAHDTQDGRRVDGLAVGLVVQAHVAAGDRDVQRAACFGDALDGLGELPHDVGPLRVAEVQAVRRAHREGARAGHVARRLGDRQPRALARVEVAVAAVAVHGERQRPPGALDAHHARTHARGRDGVRPHHVIVLPVDPALARHLRGGEQGEERVGRRGRGGQPPGIERLALGEVGRRPRGAIVERRVVRQGPVRDLGHDGAAVAHAQQPVGRHLTDADGVQIPLLEDALDLRLAPAPHDEQHPLLRLRQHDLVGRHARLALGHAADVDLDAGAAAGAHLAGRAGQAGRPHVLDADQRVGAHHFQAGLEQQLLHERVAHLDVRPFLRRRLVELGRGHRRPVDAVASRPGAHVVDRVAHPLRPAADQRVRAGRAEAEDVDEGVPRIALVERQLAADRRNADAVPVAGDARDDALHEPAGARIAGRPEPQRIEQGDRARPHGEDVADDAADPGGRALIRLDERRVVVRLDLEDRRETVADVDGAGVLARPLQHPRAGSRQLAQMAAGALVAAVLGPHDREDAELGQVRLAAQDVDHPAVLVARQAVRRDGGLVQH